MSPTHCGIEVIPDTTAAGYIFGIHHRTKSRACQIEQTLTIWLTARFSRDLQCNTEQVSTWTNPRLDLAEPRPRRCRSCIRHKSEQPLSGCLVRKLVLTGLPTPVVHGHKVVTERRRAVGTTPWSAALYNRARRASWCMDSYAWWHSYTVTSALRYLAEWRKPLSQVP